MVRLSLATSLLAAATFTQAAKHHGKGPAVLPGAYIVEYNEDHVRPTGSPCRPHDATSAPC